jgi:large subunit ribosomal protein L5
MFKRLKEKYHTEIVPAMKEKFGYDNPMTVPKFEKVVINTSFGRLVSGRPRKNRRKLFNR